MLRAKSITLLFLSVACFTGGSSLIATSSAQDAAEPVVETSKAAPSAAEAAKPDIGEQIYTQGVKWNTVVKQVEIRVADETPLRQELAQLQNRLASLYSGVELVNLIEQTKNQITVREMELKERSQSFDQQMLTIKSQLEELRRAAAAVGAGSDLEAMIESADAAAKGPAGSSTNASQQSKTPNYKFGQPLRGAQQQTPTSIKPF